MKVTDCNWEVINIGKQTIEISLDADEVLNPGMLKDIVKNYEYIVIKVPCGNVKSLLQLQDEGYKVIETQISLSKHYKDFDFQDKLLSLIRNEISFSTVNSHVHLEKVLSSITSNMFITDRVFYDSKLGPELSVNRYRNWIRSEFERESILYEIKYKNNPIGFTLLRFEQKYFHALLGGVYEKYQGEGLGILTIASGFLYCEENNIEVKKEYTAISSNNVPVMRLYNYFDFKIDKMQYVLIKHQ